MLFIQEKQHDHIIVFLVPMGACLEYKLCVQKMYKNIKNQYYKRYEISK